MEQYIENAIAAGLEEICFLDHLTLHQGGSHLSMTPDYVPFYYQSVRHLAHTFKNDIQVKAGLEVDYDPQNAEAAQKIIEPFDFDVIGGSVHFIEHVNMVSTKNTEARESESIDTLFSGYLALLAEMIDNFPVDIICHLDITKKFGRRPSADLQARFDDILDKISDKGLTVELNTSGYTHAAREFYPEPALLKKCKEKDIRMTLGSDAHRPEQVARHFDEAVALLTDAGIDRISAFTRRAPYDIPLTVSPHENP